MSNNQPTVLVAEDTADIRDILVRLLQYLGYTVTATANGREALRVLQAGLPDIVLLDLSMPQMDGWATLTALRALPGGMQTPVVAVTAHAMPDDRAAVFAHGFDGYITKPLTLHSVQEVIAQMLRRTV
jgi:CheY-like chemotaxis protein